MRTLLAVLTLTCLSLTAPPLSAAPKKKLTAAEKAFQKPVKVLIGAIRYGKDAMALKMLDLEQMTHQLNIHHWDKMSMAQRREFAVALGTLLRRLSFPKARDVFKHIDAILYDPGKVKGKQVILRNTIVIHRSYKKQEMVLTWTLVKARRGYKILDVKTVGESTIAGIREEQIDPLVKEGGVALLMKKLRQKLASTK
jgi:ABC-type transporter MlaC component